jgi:type VI secretion system protein ImpC
MFPSDKDFESKFTFETESNPSAEEPPFHLLILGNWSGDGARTDLSGRRPLVVDRDNFDEMMRKLNVSLELDWKGDEQETLSLSFAEIDDFHPDNLFRQLPVFAELRDLRRQLLNPDTFERAAGTVRSWFNSAPVAASGEQQVVETHDAPIPADNLLDAILSGGSGGSAPIKSKRADDSELGRLISHVVSPYLIKVDEAEQSKLVAALDQTTGDLMRSILHHPKFQELESAWRGLYFLVRRVETDVDLKLFILDGAQSEIADNLKSVNSLTESVLYRWMIRETLETPGGKPWAVICGNYSFSFNVDDVSTLMRLAKLSEAADAPFISYIEPAMFGYDSFSEVSDAGRFKTTEDPKILKLWSTLREQSESKYLGLSPMRFLSRTPYGRATEPTEVFAFEEISSVPAPHELVWSNPCFLIGSLLANSYRKYGWDLENSIERDVDGLPMYLFKADGENKVYPCAEIVLTESNSDLILEQGLMPLISFRDSDRVRLARLQSVATPLSKLGGKWNV